MKMFDRLIDHVVDRVMARTQHNRPAFTVNNFSHIADRGINYGSSDMASVMAIADGIVAAGLPKQQPPGRTA